MSREKFNPCSKAETIPQDSVTSAKEPKIDNAIHQNIQQGNELGTAPGVNTDVNSENNQSEIDNLDARLAKGQEKVKENPEYQPYLDKLTEKRNSLNRDLESPQSNDVDAPDEQPSQESLAKENPVEQQPKETPNLHNSGDHIRQTDNIGDFTPELRQAQENNVPIDSTDLQNSNTLSSDNNNLANQLSGESPSALESHKSDRDGVETSNSPRNSNSDIADSLSESSSPPEPSSSESSDNSEYNEA